MNLLKNVAPDIPPFTPAENTRRPVLDCAVKIP